MMEIWKNIEGFENYQVSNYGRVKSLDRIVIYNTGRKELFKSKILKQRMSKKNYHHIGLNSNKKQYTLQVHRLVALAFIPNPDNLPEVNHRDCDKSNNYAGTSENNFTDGNLEWCSHRENIIHAHTNNRWNYK